MPVLLLKATPLLAHTAQALSTGRYPLQSGLGIYDLRIINKVFEPLEGIIYFETIWQSKILGKIINFKQ